MESVRAPKGCFLIDQSTGSFHIIIEGLFFFLRFLLFVGWQSSFFSPYLYDNDGHPLLIQVKAVNNSTYSTRMILRPTPSRRSHTVRTVPPSASTARTNASTPPPTPK